MWGYFILFFPLRKVTWFAPCFLLPCLAARQGRTRADSLKGSSQTETRYIAKMNPEACDIYQLSCEGSDPRAWPCTTFGRKRKTTFTEHDCTNPVRLQVLRCRTVSKDDRGHLEQRLCSNLLLWRCWGAALEADRDFPQQNPSEKIWLLISTP